jgi:hypothetical protein
MPRSLARERRPVATSGAAAIPPACMLSTVRFEPIDMRNTEIMTSGSPCSSRQVTIRAVGSAPAVSPARSGWGWRRGCTTTGVRRERLTSRSSNSCADKRSPAPPAYSNGATRSHRSAPRPPRPLFGFTNRSTSGRSAEGRLPSRLAMTGTQRIPRAAQYCVNRALSLSGVPLCCLSSTNSEVLVSKRWRNVFARSLLASSSSENR